MSVLIKGMKMPKNCGECVFSNRETNSCFLFSQGCVDRYNINLSIKQEWCELVELTPHGRLIDADALITTFCEWGTRLERGRKLVITMCEAKQAIVDIIEDATTIIEAEVSE